tara:strand:- start:645 stop:1703 length:1059 start_codon:yes stop_codon:yes gene_type:complete
MNNLDKEVQFYENEFYTLSYLEDRIFFSSDTILNYSKFEIIFDGHIYIKDSIFLNEVKRVVTLEDIKMSYLDLDEDNLAQEFILYPFYLKHNGIHLVKDESMAYDDANFSNEFNEYLNDNSVGFPPFPSGWVLHKETKLNTLLISRIYSELILKPIIENVRKTGGYFETVNTETEILCSLDENQYLEFKETSYWNKNAEKNLEKNLEKNKYTKGMNTELVGVTLKTICAFGNSDGGVLIIGKRDDKDKSSIVGWDEDKNISKLNNRDNFELFWRAKVTSCIDKYSSNSLRFSFDTVNNKEVVRITVPPRKINESYCAVNFENKETIYIRTGNKSQPLSPTDAVKQFSGRFNN